MMDKTARLQYAMGIPSLEEEGDDAAFHALLNGVMIAMQSEMSRSDETYAAPGASAVETDPLSQVRAVLEPQQIVRIQLAALKVNDTPRPDHGINVALSYCTPESRDYLEGMVPFARLFKSYAYAPLLNFRTVEFESASIEGHHATQRFIIIAADGSQHLYAARLIQQQSGSEIGSWLTDAFVHIAG